LKNLTVEKGGEFIISGGSSILAAVVKLTVEGDITAGAATWAGVTDLVVGKGSELDAPAGPLPGWRR
jgi:hypothetical protein